MSLVRSPLTSLSSPRATGVCLPDPSPRAEMPVVLAVDDNPGILSALESGLEHYEVLTAPSGEAALTLLSAREVAVVLCDQRLPGMQGDEVLARAAAVSRATRILATAYEDLEALARAVNRGQIFAYIRKPWSTAELVWLVDSAAEHYRLDQELRHERELLHRLMEHVPDLIAVCDARGGFVRINRAMIDLLGLSDAEEAVGKRLEDFGFRADTGNRPGVDQTERIAGPAGERWLSTTRVLIDAPLEGTISISRDISERRRVRQELLHYAADLERSHRELKQFAHAAAHHFQEPLRSVASFLQLLERHCQLDDECRGFLRYAVEGAHRMKTLFRDCLAYLSAERRRPPAAVSCHDLVLRLAEELAPPDADLQVDPDLPTVTGHPELLESLFRHLLANAFTYRGSGPPRVRVLAEPRPGEWLLSVRDKGPGIDEEHWERVFGLFQRLHAPDEAPGTGLGLALCRKVVELHGGRIWCRPNRPQPGTTFYFTLPNWEEPSPSEGRTVP